MDLMLSCKEASRLTSDALDRRLGMGERIALGMHLALCAGCKRVDRQFRLLRRAMAEVSGPDQAPDEIKR